MQFREGFQARQSRHMLIQEDDIEQLATAQFNGIPSVIDTLHPVSLLVQKKYIGFQQVNLIIYPEEMCFAHYYESPYPLAVRKLGKCTIFFTFLGDGFPWSLFRRWMDNGFVDQPVVIHHNLGYICFGIGIKSIYLYSRYFLTNTYTTNAKVYPISSFIIGFFRCRLLTTIRKDFQW